MAKPAIALMVGAPKEESEMTLKAPEGFDMEGKEPGDTVEAVVELEIGQDGMLTLKKLNGIDIGGEEKKPMDDEKPDNSEGFTNAVMGGEPPEEE